MKKVILFLFIFATTTAAIAQEVTKVPLTQEVRSEWYTFKNNDETIIVQNYKEKGDIEYLITIVGDKQQTKKSHKLAQTDDILINATFTENLVYFLFQANNYDEGKIEHYVLSVNVSDFSESKRSLFTVVDTNSKTVKRYFKVRPGTIFGEVRVVDDYTAIVYDIRTKEDKTRTALLFDKQYNEVFSQTKTYSGYREKDNRFIHVSSYVDEDNLGVVVLNRKRDSNTFKLEHINTDGYTSKDFEFDKNGQRDLSIVKADNGFHVVGFFYNEDKGVEDALFYASFSNDLSLLDEKYIQLSADFFSDLNKKQKKKGMLLDLHSVLTDDDENIYIIGEAKRIGVAGRDAEGFSNLYGIPDDVVVCKVDKNAKLVWSTLVNKSQKFYKTEYASFRPFLMHNQLHYVFNSDLNMEKVKTDRKSSKGIQPGSGQRFSVYLVSFDTNGGFEHFKLTDKKVDLRYMTTNSGLIKNESINLFGTRKRVDGFLSIQF